MNGAPHSTTYKVHIKFPTVPRKLVFDLHLDENFLINKKKCPNTLFDDIYLICLFEK
jgi:hypothetical protein